MSLRMSYHVTSHDGCYGMLRCVTVCNSCLSLLATEDSRLYNMKFHLSMRFFGQFCRLRGLDPSINLKFPWITNCNSVDLFAMVSGTCFRVLSTMLYLYEHCPYLTYYFFLFSQFLNHCTKMLAISIVLQHSYCNIIFLIIQFQ